MSRGSKRSDNSYASFSDSVTALTSCSSRRRQAKVSKRQKEREDRERHRERNEEREKEQDNTRLPSPKSIATLAPRAMRTTPTAGCGGRGVNSEEQTLHSTQYTVHSTSTQYTVHSPQSTVYSPQSTVHSMRYIVQKMKLTRGVNKRERERERERRESYCCCSPANGELPATFCRAFSSHRDKLGARKDNQGHYPQYFTAHNIPHSTR